MANSMGSPPDKQPPNDWWLENSCRIAAFRLRHHQYISANTIPAREQIRDSVEFVRLVWEEIERQLRESDPG